MPRGPGLDAPNVLLHVMVRGIERRAIFRDDQDRTPFVTRVAAQAVEARVEEVDVIGNVPHYVPHYRARYYHPDLARFISEDPLGVAGGLNFYAYVGNNPISYADPFGLCRDPGGPGIRYCIETFIPQDKAWGFGGDNRSPDPNGGTFRTHQEIYQTPHALTTERHRPGISTFGPFAREAVMGPFSWEVKDFPLGGRKITVSGAASDGLLYNYAPDANYRLTILETADGSAKVVGGEATAFPSIEVWQYGGPGSGPRLTYTYDAEAASTGPADLLRRVPLP